MNTEKSKRPPSAGGTALRLRNRAIEASSNGIMICDAASTEMPILYVNPAFERITGYVTASIGISLYPASSRRRTWSKRCGARCGRPVWSRGICPSK